MKISCRTFKSSDVAKNISTDLLVIPLMEGGAFTRLGNELNRSMEGWLSKLVEREQLRGKIGDSRLIDTQGKIAAHSLLLVGVGKGDLKNGEVLRKFAAAAIKTGHKIHAKKITLEDFSGKKKIPAEKRGVALSEGIELGNYSFDLYKSEKASVKKTVQEVEILTSESSSLEKGIKKGMIFADSTNLARDLINIPASDMTPKHMADEARKIGKLPGLSVKIHDKKEIEKMGMGCYLAVSKGSTEPPYLIHLTYKPIGKGGKVRKKIAVVGKGVTFDSGGLSLKPANSMETMKDDMSGAAAMLGIMKALSSLKPHVEVHGISAVTENMPSGSADKPGDIAKALNGKTVEILNTDAEGRLTLADAIGYAQKQNPDIIIDMATLTGACVVALGELCSAILGNNQALIDHLIQCGEEAGEKIWQMPLIEEYKEDLKSPIADLKNVGGRWGGTINGALFIQEFVDPKIQWAHIDIAGPSWTEKELAYCPRGGTGHITRTLLNFILKI